MDAKLEFENPYLKENLDKIRKGGIITSGNYGATHSERAQIELAVVNYETATLMAKSIEVLSSEVTILEKIIYENGKKSDKSSRAMLWLSFAMFFIGIVQVGVAVYEILGKK